MHNPFINGWLADQEQRDRETLFSAPNDGLIVVSESEAVAAIEEAAKTPITTHPWHMAKQLHDQRDCVYERLTTYNQDANNCAAQGTSKAVDAFMLISKWQASRQELTPFETFVPWIYGVGKNDAGHYGDNGATMGSMMRLIANRGVLPTDTPGLPPYAGTSRKWCQRYGNADQAKNAPFYPFLGEAKQYIVTAAELPRDPDLFRMACMGGYSLAFGTRQRIRISGSGDKRRWSASGSWMHAMAAYGYDEELDAVGVDNSHGDGFAWASRDVIRAIVKAGYFDAFVILDIKPRPGKADWSTVGRN